jgi:hypothetical protein
MSFFNKGFLVLTFFLVVSLGLIQYFNVLKQPITWWYWFSIVFFGGITFITFKMSERSLKKRGGQQINTALGGTFLRFFLSIVFISIYLYINTLDRFQFVTYFFLVFLFYLMFELYCLVTKLRPEK